MRAMDVSSRSGAVSGSPLGEAGVEQLLPVVVLGRDRLTVPEDARSYLGQPRASEVQELQIARRDLGRAALGHPPGGGRADPDPLSPAAR